MPEGPDPQWRQRAVDPRPTPYLYRQLSAFALLAITALTSGCDLGPHDEEAASGPALHLVASYPADGQGTNATLDAAVDCNSPTPDCPLPTNLALELRFDRFLLPSGGLSEGLRLYTGSPANAVSLRARYDLIERVVVLRPSRALQPNTLYTVEIQATADVTRGFWAFDRARLEPGPVPLRFSFTTGQGASAPLPALASASDTCDTMSWGPLRSCASCHATQPAVSTGSPIEYPPLGLDLSSARGLFFTAVSHVAHQAQTGSSASGSGLQAPARFGVQMNLVDPGNPATSYLMYKLLLKPQNFALDPSEPGCASGYHPPVADRGCSPPDAAELSRLRDWFVQGEPMPPDALGETSAASLSHAQLVRIAAWIAAGASCPH